MTDTRGGVLSDFLILVFEALEDSGEYLCFHNVLGQIVRVGGNISKGLANVSFYDNIGMRDQSSQKSHRFLLYHLGSSRLRVKRNLSQRLYGYAFQFEFRFLHTLNDSFQRIRLYNLLSQFSIMLSN